MRVKGCSVLSINNFRGSLRLKLYKQITNFGAGAYNTWHFKVKIHSPNLSLYYYGPLPLSYSKDFFLQKVTR